MPGTDNNNDHEHDTGPDEARPRTVNVMCTRPGGLQLRLYREHHLEKQMGPRTPNPHKEIVVLNTGANEVDEVFLDAWLEENPGSEFVENGVLVLPKKNEEPARDADAERKPRDE